VNDRVAAWSDAGVRCPTQGEVPDVDCILAFREAHLVEPVDEDPWIGDPGGWAPPLAEDAPG
jgi:hypothetical protein